MGIVQTKTLEMATMAVINHTEEELDDDIVSNLSLNLMVSDNEDAGSPNSDRFDKLDSRDESPDDSNNCDNTEEDMCMNSELKDDLQQLRDFTGDNCWSALDDVDNNEISSDVDKEILTETGNKETTSLDTEKMDNEDNMGMTEENNSPCMEELNENKTTQELNENKTTEDDSLNNQYSAMVSTKGKEDEMENEERLLNDIRDNEKDTFDCENLDEDALLSDPRDEDLLQITEEKTTEKDAADFLKSCQEEQEADEFSSSSTEKAEDNLFESAGDYEESNTELLEPELEPVDTVMNDNYDHSDIDNVMGDEVSLHLAKDGDEKREEDNGESNTLNGEVEDIHTENADVSMHSDNNIKEKETNSIGCFNTTADIGEESGERIDSLEDESTFENSHEESYRFEQTESEKHIGNDTEQEILLNEADAPTKISAMFDLSETALSETGNKKMDTLANDISSKAEIANDDTISDNIPYQDVNNDVDAITENITDEAEATNVDTISDNKSCEDAMKEVDTISENVCVEGEGSEVDVISGNMPDDSEVTNENEDLQHLPNESILPIECATEEDVSKEDYQEEIQTHKDVIMVDQVENNEAPGIITNSNELALDDITEDKEELSSYDSINDQEESALVDITNDNEKLEIEDDRPNNKQAQAVDSLTAVAVVADKPIEIDSEPMDVDDMEFEVAPIQSFIEKDASGISKSVDIVDSFNGTERTEESKSVTNNAQLGVEDNANIADHEKDDCRNDVEFIHNDTKLNPSASTSNNIQDENIINLIDECEPDVITDAAQTAMLNVQHQTADTATTHDIVTTDSLQSTFLHASKTVKPSGIEGDNKECEDMDIEEITPYKETATRPNGSVLMQILSTNSVPDTLSSSSPFASLPTTTDNNVVLVSPQPGEKRLSSDNFKTESSKRRKLATPAVREIRQKYLESFKQAMASASWSRIGRRQLEEFATQKLLEAIHYKTEMGELHKKCMEYKQSLENLRTNSLTLTKQLRDMNSVHIKLEREINILKTRHRDDDKPLVAVKITRSVGLQALVEDPKVNRRGRPTNAAGAARTVTQNQPVPVLQKQQQLAQPPHPPQPSHPPQLQQKPMNQQKPVQVQVPQRVIVSTSAAPPLQARPVRSMATLPSGVSPVQTRTMSRNKKIAAVSSTNPPPLRSLNQQQSTTTTNTLPAGSTISIPIKHITGPTILNKSIAVSIPTVTTPVITTPMTETSKAVIDLTDEDDVGKKLSPVKVNQPPQQQQQQQQRITLMSTVVNGQQVLLRVDGGGPIPSKATTALTNGTPLFVQSPMQLQQRTATTNAVKVMTNIPPRTRTSSAVQTPIPNQQNSVLPPVITQSSPPNQARRFRHPAPLPTPPSSQNLIKGNKPIPPKPTVTVNKSPNGSGIIVKWNMPSMLSLFEKIVRYELFVYQVTKSPPRTDSWGKINDVGALDLPMAVSLTEFAEGNRYYFAVRAVDELGRLGPFSEPQTIVF